jgi:hypothetical protein
MRMANCEGGHIFRTITRVSAPTASGRFIRDPLIRQRRREKVRKLTEGAFTEENYQEIAGGTWLELSDTEREALRRFLRRG